MSDVNTTVQENIISLELERRKQHMGLLGFMNLLGEDQPAEYYQYLGTFPAAIQLPATGAVEHNNFGAVAEALEFFVNYPREWRLIGGYFTSTRPGETRSISADQEIFTGDLLAAQERMYNWVSKRREQVQNVDKRLAFYVLVLPLEKKDPTPFLRIREFLNIRLCIRIMENAEKMIHDTAYVRDIMA